MIEITFKYKDKYSNWEWKTQHCTVSSINECVKIYGLDRPDVEYEIIEIKEI